MMPPKRLRGNDLTTATGRTVLQLLEFQNFWILDELYGNYHDHMDAGTQLQSLPPRFCISPRFMPALYSRWCLRCD
jgi:hypothetical protein